jgi:ATP-binding cassette subfamily B protein
MLALSKLRRSASADTAAGRISEAATPPRGTNIPFAQYRRALAFVSPYWWRLALVAALGLFSTAVGLAQPYISRLLIDDALVRHNLRALWTIAGLMVVVTITGFALNICSSYLYIRFSAECLFDMRLAVYRHLQKLSPRFFAKSKLGDIVSRINNDIGEVQRICADTLLSFLSNVLFFVGSVAIMISLNWRLFLVGVVLLPLSIFAVRHYQHRLAAEAKTMRERSSELGSFLIESILGMRLVVATANEQRETEEFRRRNSNFIRSLLSMQWMSFLGGALPGSVLTISSAIVFLYGGKLVIDGRLSIGALVAFMAYHMRLLSPVQTLIGSYSNLVTGGVSLGRVFELFDTPAEVQESPNAQPRGRLRGEVLFDQVRFRFSPDVSVLEDVSFCIPAGSICAVVGASGAGKSTLADLVLRFYDPESGAVRIDGYDVRTLRLGDLRRDVALVEQTPYLFRASVRENIAYGKPGATFDEIRACARHAAIDAFIDSLPEGYDTIIGERGSTISAGERQRIALARALLRDPSVLVMDEPTSALDPVSENSIANALSGAFTGRTVMLITHRMSLAAKADKVVFMENGRIVQEGTPRELLSLQGGLDRHFPVEQAPIPEVA